MIMSRTAPENNGIYYTVSKVPLQPIKGLFLWELLDQKTGACLKISDLGGDSCFWTDLSQTDCEIKSFIMRQESTGQLSSLPCMSSEFSGSYSVTCPGCPQLLLRLKPLPALLPPQMIKVVTSSQKKRNSDNCGLFFSGS